jgi:hypothetical protein
LGGAPDAEAGAEDMRTSGVRRGQRRATTVDDVRWGVHSRRVARAGVCASRAFERARKGRVASFRLSIGTTKGFFFGFSGAFFVVDRSLHSPAAPRHAHGEDYGTTDSLRTRAS